MSLTVVRCSDINKFSKFITYITFSATTGTTITSNTNTNSLLLSLNTSSNDTKQRLLLVSSSTSTLSLVEQVIYLEVKSIIASRSAAITHGYDIIKYYDDNDTKLCSIQGTIYY